MINEKDWQGEGGKGGGAVSVRQRGSGRRQPARVGLAPTDSRVWNRARPRQRGKACPERLLPFWLRFRLWPQQQTLVWSDGGLYVVIVIVGRLSGHVHWEGPVCRAHGFQLHPRQAARQFVACPARRECGPRQFSNWQYRTKLAV